MISLSIFFFAGCSTSQNGHTPITEKIEEEDTSVNIPRINVPDMNITVTIRGIAVNRKGGAVVISNENGKHYWIDGLDSWPDEYNDMPVAVKGQLEERNDAPVFMDTSEIKSQGIPVHSEEEAENQSKRTWILNATYELVKN